ncbi:MAG: replicative DNA helicase [Clostridiales bacterium]|nr:replicative DNA helicase [Clostridiales bacterium]
MPNEDNQSLFGQPYSAEAEQAVLGSILIDFSCMNVVTDHIKQDYFYLPQHRVIYACMLSMFMGSSKQIDPIVIADELVKQGHYDASGGREYLVTLRDSVPSAANAEAYAKIIEEQYYLRTLMTLSQNIINRASGGTDANELLNFAEQSIYDIRRDKEIGGLKKVSDVIINDVYDRLGKLTGDDAEQYKAIPTGFGTLDKYITGFNKSDLIIIGARPGMGKTSFALNLAHNVCVSAKKKCAFFCLEMTREQLAERLLASQSGVSSQKIRTGELSNDEWVRLGYATGVYNNVELYLDDTSFITVPEIKSRVRRAKDIDVVIVDYLGLIQSAVKKDNRVQEVQEITRSLKMLAKDLNIPVICCAQLSRNSVARGKSSRPQLSDLRESGSIEQDADIVLFLYNKSIDVVQDEADSDDEDENPDSTQLIIAKNRHGATGVVEMIFDREFTRFKAIDSNENYDER